MLDLGQAYPIAFDVHDENGALANAATVTAAVTFSGDGTTETLVITNPPAVTGKYRYTYLPATAGHYAWSAVTTQPNTAWGDTFNVRAYRSIIGLAEAKAHLSGGSTAAWTADDDELRTFLQASTELIESQAGPCVRQTVTERVSGRNGTPRLRLARPPVISVTSITSRQAGGPAWATADLDVDADLGVVTLARPGRFWGGPWDAVYIAGRTVIPERLQHAQKELLRHLWETQRGQLAAPVLGGEGTFTTSAGWTFTYPRRVMEAISGDQMPVIA